MPIIRTSCVVARRSDAARHGSRFGAAALLIAVAAALLGCGVGFGSGEESGKAELLVTRDFGAERLVEAPEISLRESDTVMRVLDRNAEVETRYGGGFVHAIDGLAGNQGTQPLDWFYFVNGIEADRGSADYRLSDGDRVWWDFRDWGASMRVPAVVGQYPEPFINGYGSSEKPLTTVECRDAGEACAEIERRLAEAGAALVADEGAEGGSLNRVIVGPWRSISEEWAARAIAEGPELSGVYLKVEVGADAGDEVTFVALNAKAEETARYKAGNGLIAALRQGEARPTWLVTGSDQEGLDAAAASLDADALAGKFALLVTHDGGLGLPRP